MMEVTIGMPLYNNAQTINKALDSLLSQTVQDIKIIISDDCSEDDTGSICRNYARRDSRIEYVRQSKNIGYQNFRYVLQKASTPFFMWAAGDDQWHPTFIEKNLSALKSNPSLICSVSKVLFDLGAEGKLASKGTYPLTRDIKSNIACYLASPEDNSRMYGLFRTEVLMKSFPKKTFHAYDWALCAATLVYGKHNEIPEILMFRDYTAPERYVDLARKDHRAFLFRLFPLARMTYWLLFEARIPVNRYIAMALFVLNIEKHWEYCKKFHPRYFRWSANWRRRLNRYVRWRLDALCKAVNDKAS